MLLHVYEYTTYCASTDWHPIDLCCHSVHLSHRAFEFYNPPDRVQINNNNTNRQIVWQWQQCTLTLVMSLCVLTPTRVMQKGKIKYSKEKMQIEEKKINIMLMTFFHHKQVPLEKKMSHHRSWQLFVTLLSVSHHFNNRNAGVCPALPSVNKNIFNRGKKRYMYTCTTVHSG